jgi:hypothetical protein
LIEWGLILKGDVRSTQREIYLSSENEDFLNILSDYLSARGPQGKFHQSAIAEMWLNLAIFSVSGGI